jgi:hypothetical protein
LESIQEEISEQAVKLAVEEMLGLMTVAETVAKVVTEAQEVPAQAVVETEALIMATDQMVLKQK